jgi:hypothetical protein
MINIFNKLATDYVVTYNNNIYKTTDWWWGFPFMLLWLTIAIIVIAGMWQVFKKAGRPGWAAIVPVYNTLQLIWLNKKPWWWILLMLIPFVNIVIIIMLYYYTAQAFGKGLGTTLLLIFIPVVGWPYLGFSDAKYQLTKSAGSRGRRR